MQDIKTENLGSDIPEHFGGFDHKEFLIAPVDWFETIGAPKPLHDAVTSGNEATSFAEAGEISTAHVFKTGYGFMTLHTAIETTEITGSYLGEGTNKIIGNEVKTVLEDSRSEILGFSRWVKNQRVIILVKESNSGNYRQLGTNVHGAIASEFEPVVEGSREGLNRRTFTFSDKAQYEAPVYTGTVTKMPAQV